MPRPSKLHPTEKYLDDSAKYVGDDESAAAWGAHRRLLRRIVAENFSLPPGRHRISRKEDVGQDTEVWVSAIVDVANPTGVIVVELRGLRVQGKATAIL